MITSQEEEDINEVPYLINWSAFEAGEEENYIPYPREKLNEIKDWQELPYPDLDYDFINEIRVRKKLIYNKLKRVSRTKIYTPNQTISRMSRIRLNPAVTRLPQIRSRCPIKTWVQNDVGRRKRYQNNVNDDLMSENDIEEEKYPHTSHTLLERSRNKNTKGYPKP
jgi:hypothetical protein